METLDDGFFEHDEADIAIVSYVLRAAESGTSIIRVLSDDTDIFVLLVYLTYKAALSSHIQMEKWDGSVFDINATCNNLRHKCLELLGMHALSGCDTTSYPYGKGKVTALNTLQAGDFSDLDNVLGETGVTHSQLQEAGFSYLSALYHQPNGIAMETVRYNIYSKQKKSPKIMTLPPTGPNLFLHILRCHLQVTLWKAANKTGPPTHCSDIQKFGWEIKDNIPMPVISDVAPAPPGLSDVISCGCKSLGNTCSNNVCSCNKNKLSCTTYCHCNLAEDVCNNPHTKNDDVDVEAIQRVIY